MLSSYRNADEFQASEEHFRAMIEWLLSESMSDCDHGEVEDFLHCEGHELLRRLLQGYLDMRSDREEVHDVMVDSDGVAHTHRRRDCHRTLMSEFGEVSIRRIGYSGRGLAALYPLDRELNLPPDKYSHGLRLRAVEEAIKSSFDESVLSIEKTTGGSVPKSQLRGVVAHVSQDFLSYYEQRENDLSQVDDLLVMSSDGKGIVMRQEDLRPATKAAAQKRDARRGLRLKSGEKSHRKRMAHVAAIYDIAPYVRRAEDVVHHPPTDSPEADPPPPKPPRPRPSHKRVWASVEAPLEEVIEQLLDEALERDPEQARRWVMVIDGHDDQLRTIERLAEHKQLTLTIVLDVIHVLEYLWKAAFCFFDSHHEHGQAEQWVSERLQALLEGHAASDVAAGMRRSATRQNFTQPQRQAVDACADYLIKYKDFLHYEHYLAQGYPIGSGVIEGTCRHLINDRLDITGARWRLTTSEALLKLRSLKASGDLDEYFRFHQTQERQRNHVSKFYTSDNIAA